MQALTLQELALKHARGELSSEEVFKLSKALPPVERASDGVDSWYEGELENTTAGVEALVGRELTREEAEAFFAVLAGRF